MSTKGLRTGLSNREHRIERACAVLKSEKAREVFRKLAYEHPHCSVFWDQDDHEATLWDDSDGADFYIAIA